MTALTDRIDLASARLGGAALLASDEFFAEKENLLKPGRGVFLPDKYTDRGKWMDGWETRRKRGPGHDWCILRLGVPGCLDGFDVDTNHFLGNFPEFCAIDACAIDDDSDLDWLGSDAVPWIPVLPLTPLQGGSSHLLPIPTTQRFTHVRLRIYPDGGVARLRVFGSAIPDWSALRSQRQPIDLAAAVHGGVAPLCSDMFFSHRNNLLMPGRSENMGDGWETRRRRGPGNDWIIVELGAPGTISRVEVDTNHFKGNFPESCSLDATELGQIPPDAPPELLRSLSVAWRPLLPRTRLQAHTRHFFEPEILAHPTISHVRLNIFPDGGVSRLRLDGIPDWKRLGL